MKKLTTIFVFTIIIIIGCTQDSKRDTLFKDEQSCQFVDPVNDLVAFLDPVQSKLFVLPDHKDIVIQTLGAEPLDDEMYTMNAVTVSRKNIKINFKISILNTPSLIYDQADMIDLIMEDARGRLDTSRGYFLRTFRNITGTFYKIYKNAECKKVRDSSRTDCIKEIICEYKGINPYDSTKILYQVRETGNYIKTEYDEFYNCIKGDNYCVKAYIITERRIIYNDSNCTQAINVNPSYNYSCIK